MFAIERNNTNQRNIFEVFVEVKDTCNVYSNEPYSAASIADELNRRLDIMKCTGYEKVTMSSDTSAFARSYYIFTCVCSQPCTTYTMRTYVNMVTDQMIHVL